LNGNHINNKTKGAIARVVANKEFYPFDNYIYSNDVIINDGAELELYPIMTLSTCTDNDRFLRGDGFGMLRFINFNEIEKFEEIKTVNFIDLFK